ncbi:MAG TPA: T9SS type A sorting domain-containing protein, partial [Prolixibacteraceae bacterium]|nr:T9SS type A sorting domain-containing protein [Prolixibacteraceae bacterium]
TYICAVSDGTNTRYDSTKVYVVPPPGVYAGPDTLVCLSATSISLHGTASNYRMLGWTTNGNGTFSNSSSPVTDYTFGPKDKAQGSVNLQLIGIANLPCAANATSTMHIVFDPCNGIDDLSGGNLAMMIHPNPATESATFTLSGLQHKTAEFSITNMEGQTVYKCQIGTTDHQVMKQVNLAGFPKGIYLAQVKTDSQVATQRLVIQ